MFSCLKINFYLYLLITCFNFLEIKNGSCSIKMETENKNIKKIKWRLKFWNFDVLSLSLILFILCVNFIFFFF